MPNLTIVVDEPSKDEFLKRGLKVITPMEYIMENDKESSLTTFNLSSHLGYQDIGYYVSLLALARKDKIYPSAKTIQDFKDKKIARLYSEEISDLVQKNFKKLTGQSFELSVYFGQNLTKQYNSLCWELYRLIQAPMFRVYFTKNGDWEISKIKLITWDEISKVHKEFIFFILDEMTLKNKSIRSHKNKYFYDLAILYNKDEKSPPSDAKALKKFIEAFKKKGIRAELIQYSDRPNISEYDALFIRETTNVSHHTYKLARRAEKDGLVVIDDPDSIVKCTNKIFLEQLLDKMKVNRPKSYIFDKKNYDSLSKKVSFPCVIKKPDSAFSQGVYKANDREELDALAKKTFEKTQLILVQEYIPTDFDWRIGILDNKVLYACKYFMASGHWQIVNNNKEGIEVDSGDFECLDPIAVDDIVLKTALKVTKKIGRGLYGVDLKQKGKDIYLIEVNDNPSIDYGIEDHFLKDDLYLQIADYFLTECNKKRGLHVS